MQRPISPLEDLNRVLTIDAYTELNDIGNIPYVLARPFLVKVESPEKLVSL